MIPRDCGIPLGIAIPTYTHLNTGDWRVRFPVGIDICISHVVGKISAKTAVERRGRLSTIIFLKLPIFGERQNCILLCKHCFTVILLFILKVFTGRWLFSNISSTGFWFSNEIRNSKDVHKRVIINKIKPIEVGSKLTSFLLFLLQLISALVDQRF